MLHTYTLLRSTLDHHKTESIRRGGVNLWGTRQVADMTNLAMRHVRPQPCAASRCHPTSCVKRREHTLAPKRCTDHLARTRMRLQTKQHHAAHPAPKGRLVAHLGEHKPPATGRLCSYTPSIKPPRWPIKCGWGQSQVADMTNLAMRHVRPQPCAASRCHPTSRVERREHTLAPKRRTDHLARTRMRLRNKAASRCAPSPQGEAGGTLGRAQTTFHRKAVLIYTVSKAPHVQSWPIKCGRGQPRGRHDHLAMRLARRTTLCGIAMLTQLDNSWRHTLAVRQSLDCAHNSHRPPWAL
jgi:hypothetical protein